MRTITIAHQLRLDGEPIPVRRLYFDTPVSALRKLAEDDQARCAWCGEDFFKHARLASGFYHYDSPWGEELTDDLCPACASQYRDDWHVDGYFDCDTCERTIATNHGHRSYERYLDSGAICAACLQEKMLKDSELVDRWLDGDDEVPLADFYDHEGPQGLPARGYRLDAELFVDSQAGALELRRRIRLLRAEDWHVVVDLGRQSIMGGEGWFNLWVREGAAGETGYASA